MLEKKEKVLQKKAAAEVEKAKEFTRAKNKRGMTSVSLLLGKLNGNTFLLVDGFCIFILIKTFDINSMIC